MPAKVAHLIFDFAVATQFEKIQIRVNYAGSAVVNPENPETIKLHPLLLSKEKNT